MVPVAVVDADAVDVQFGVAQSSQEAGPRRRGAGQAQRFNQRFAGEVALQAAIGKGLTGLEAGKGILIGTCDTGLALPRAGQNLRKHHALAQRAKVIRQLGGAGIHPIEAQLEASGP